ncbi:hypothetical protein ACIRQQ_40590 [Streptomyces fuscichromogenes]|uniref:hypothetical protein n=1 Tax=Streptomyces fuscichromogenes TaxID=1324013 RepID=UPI00382A87CE
MSGKVRLAHELFGERIGDAEFFGQLDRSPFIGFAQGVVRQAGVHRLEVAGQFDAQFPVGRVQEQAARRDPPRPGAGANSAR